MGVHLRGGRFVDDFGNSVSGEMKYNSSGQILEVEHPSHQMDRLIAAAERTAAATEQHNRDYKFHETMKFYGATPAQQQVSSYYADQVEAWKTCPKPIDLSNNNSVVADTIKTVSDCTDAVLDKIIHIW